MHLREQIRLACLLEAAARKPGNVHPQASFSDLCYADFVQSARVIAPIVAQAAHWGVGRTIQKAVEATKHSVGKNTNLGIVLLLTPLAAAAPFASASEGFPSAHADRSQQPVNLKDPSEPDRERPIRHRGETFNHRVSTVLARLTQRDAELAFQAIRLASPGGLGHVDHHDVAQKPAVTLLEAMQAAANRDTIAEQYSTGFDLILNQAVPRLSQFWRENPDDWETPVIRLHLQLMSIRPDSLIARKCGRDVADESAKRANRVLAAEWPDGSDSHRLLSEFDRWLRADGNRLNPGTTADLVAATLFAALSERKINISHTVLDKLNAVDSATSPAREF